jgi:hypothetical protein
VGAGTRVGVEGSGRGLGHSGARSAARREAALHSAQLDALTPPRAAPPRLPLSQAGLPPDEIADRLRALGAQEPSPDFTAVPALPRPLPGLTVKLHSPPRLSKKVDSPSARWTARTHPRRCRHSLNLSQSAKQPGFT